MSFSSSGGESQILQLVVDEQGDNDAVTVDGIVMTTSRRSASPAAPAADDDSSAAAGDRNLSRTGSSERPQDKRRKRRHRRGEEAVLDFLNKNVEVDPQRPPLFAVQFPRLFVY